MKLALVANLYPSFSKQVYKHIFFHERARQYVMWGHRVKTYSRPTPPLPSYESYEGVEIYRGDLKACKESIQAWKPYLVLVHCPHR